MNNKLRIGPSGNSITFYEQGYKRTIQAGKWLYDIGLNAYEYSFGRGINMSSETAIAIGEEFCKKDVLISVHAPYYINLANPDFEMIKKSFGYIIDSVQKVNQLGGSRVVIHSGAKGKFDRSESVQRIKSNYLELFNILKDHEIQDFILCPETMGKINQIGTVEEILEICQLHEKLIPCFDFGHINCYTFGGIKAYEDYANIIEKSISAIGIEKTSNMHVRYTKIQYGKMGEIKHLDLSDKIFGPDFAPLAKVIKDYNLQPNIICESSQVMSDDALEMKHMLSEHMQLQF